MTANYKKTDAKKLIAKINEQSEIIDKQNIVSSIDIDIQLDYIRALYEFYIELKQNQHIVPTQEQNQNTVPKQEQSQHIVPKEQTEKKYNNLSECGTLSLFDDLEEKDENIDKEKEKNIAISEPSNENQIQTEIQKKSENEISHTPALPKISEFEKHEQITSPQIEDIEENTQQIKNIEEDTPQIKDIEEDIPQAKDIKEDTPQIKNIEEEDIQQAKDIEEDIPQIKDIEEEDTQQIKDIKEDTLEVKNIEEDTPQIENSKEDTPQIKAFPEMEFELNLKKNDFPARNQDNTIVAEKEIPETTVAPSTQPQYKGSEEPLPDKPTSIGDKYKSNRPSLNEIVSGFKPDESIGMKLQHGNVSDLMKSIDLNLKFLFVKELFNGNGSIFTEEINTINNITKLHNAISYMEEMKDKYKWDEKNEAYKELFKLVLRKYAK
ncbi:MAG: hypothetical protein LBE13_21805 [Bacteroidales bacterium]|jgi:hypothetical protein|nr:hypothetical protein [Bacteroidales bacterium]